MARHVEEANLQNGALWADQAVIIAASLAGLATNWFTLCNPDTMVLQGEIAEYQGKFDSALEALGRKIARTYLPPSLQTDLNDLGQSVKQVEEMVRKAYHKRGAKWRKAHLLMPGIHLEIPVAGPSRAPVLSKQMSCSHDPLELPAIDGSKGADTSSLSIGGYLRESSGVKTAPRIDRSHLESTLTLWRDEIEKVLATGTDAVSHASKEGKGGAPSAYSHDWEEKGQDAREKESVSLLFSLRDSSVSVKPGEVYVFYKTTYPLTSTSEDPAGLLSLIEAVKEEHRERSQTWDEHAEKGTLVKVGKYEDRDE